MLYQTFTFEKIKYIAIPMDEGKSIHILGADGVNYGRWHSIESFKWNISKGRSGQYALGQAVLSIRPV
jgi:hypothetical protein